MKSSVLASLTFIALCSAKLYCNDGTTANTLYCCFDVDKPVYSGDPYINARKGCGDPKGGQKINCDYLSDGLY
ncbi:hypothetical protein BUE80_DR003720, partial [Diplocarpon rosae]